MEFLDLTLPTIAENLALDEALLEQVDGNPEISEVLRLWESPQHAVILGRGTDYQKEIQGHACEADSVPVFRRCSGGTAVVVGPGCLMYAVVLRYTDRPELRQVDVAHQFVMSRIQTACQAARASQGVELAPEGQDQEGRLGEQATPGEEARLGQVAASEQAEAIEFLGTCDLTLEGRKFSGNALRVRRECLLYHGTILYDYPLEKIGRYLGRPARQPDYRKDRPHDAFVCNLPATVEKIRESLRRSWGADEARLRWPDDDVQRLVQQKYLQHTWNFGSKTG